MQASQLPSRVPLPWANAGTKNTIPTASQIGITAGAASLTDGFPPLTMTPLVSGGVPPSGADMNGILNLITAVQQWQCAGGIFKYDSAFSTSIGGYPKGSILMSTSNDTAWLCLADNNTTDPDGGSAANWAPLAAYGITAVTGLTNANVTLTPAQYGKNIITLSGTLTGNVQINFPTTLQRWMIINNTTGSFSITAKTVSGTGIDVPQGQGRSIYGDGTNILALGLTPVETKTKLTSGSGTYTTPAGARQLKIRMVGAGGGGSGGGTSGGAGGIGGTTTFNSVNANGGNGASGSNGATGGSAGTGTANLRMAGNGGASGIPSTAATTGGGIGGGSFFGGGGAPGTAGATNTGGGGSGGAGTSTSVPTGAGGGGGEYVELIINTPASSYSYAVGAAGTAGSAGTGGTVGFAGGSGIIEVTEIY